MEPTYTAMKRAPQSISLNEWMLCAGALALLCSHAWALWSNTPWYILTLPVMWVAALTALVSLSLSRSENRHKERKNISLLRLIMRGTLALLFALFLLSPVPNYIKDVGIRHRVHIVSNEAQLLAWAEQLFCTPLEELHVKEHHGNTYWLDESKLPAYVHSISAGPFRDYHYRLVDEGPKGRYLEIYVWHGRPQSWGILLCSPSFHPERLENRWLLRWREGLYGWQQLNAIS